MFAACANEGEVGPRFGFFSEFKRLQMHFRRLIEQTTYGIDVNRQQRRQRQPISVSPADLSPADKQCDFPGGRSLIVSAVATDGGEAEPGRQAVGYAVGKLPQPVGNVVGMSCLRHRPEGGQGNGSWRLRHVAEYKTNGVKNFSESL